jgi:hypothetical protein
MTDNFKRISEPHCSSWVTSIHHRQNYGHRKWRDYRDLLRRGGDLGILAEYDRICSQLEADVRGEVAPTLSWAMIDRNT